MKLPGRLPGQLQDTVKELLDLLLLQTLQVSQRLGVVAPRSILKPRPMLLVTKWLLSLLATPLFHLFLNADLGRTDSTAHWPGLPLGALTQTSLGTRRVTARGQLPQQNPRCNFSLIRMQMIANIILVGKTLLVLLSIILIPFLLGQQHH